MPPGSKSCRCRPESRCSSHRKSPGSRERLGSSIDSSPAERAYVFTMLTAPVAQTCSLSVSPEIVAAREDFFNHGWTRINTDEDGFSLIRVHPCSSVVGSYWLRLRRAALYRRMPSCRTAPWPGRRNTAKALPICNRRYGRLAICATLNRDGALRCDGRRTGVHARWRWNAKHIRKPPEPARWKAT